MTAYSNVSVQRRASGGFVNAISGDTVREDAAYTFGTDLVVEGNLDVQGIITKIDSATLNIGDNNILLNSGQTSASALTGGWTVVISASLPDTVNGSFVAGVAATSNPTVVTTGAATYSVGDLLLLVDTTEAGNSGLFECLSHAANLLTIRGVGTTAVVETFTQNQFIADATAAAGTINKVTVAVSRFGTDGVLETGTGSATPITFTDVGTAAGNSLQQAYDTGAAIITDSGQGAVAISGTEQVTISATNGLVLTTQFDADTSAFDVQMTGSNGVFLRGTAASLLRATGGTLTLESVTSGDVDINSAAALTMDGATTFALAGASGQSTIGAPTMSITTSTGELDIAAQTNLDLDGPSAVRIDSTAGLVSIQGFLTSDFTVSANDAALRALRLISENSGGEADIIIDAQNTLDIDAADMTVNVTAGGTWTATSSTLFFRTLTSGDIDINSVGAVDIDGNLVQINALAGVAIAGVTDSSFDLNANSAGLQVLSLDAGNIGAGAANLTLNAKSEIDLTAGTVLDLNSDIYTLNTTDSISMSSTGTTTIGAADDLSIESTSSGSLSLTSAGDSVYTVPANSGAAWSLTDGSDTYINIDSTNSLEAIDLDTHVNIIEGAGFERTTSVGLVAGNLLSYTAADPSELRLADADQGTIQAGMCVGVSRGVFSSSATAQVFSVPGCEVPVLFASAPAAADNGKPVFVSTVAGNGILTPPQSANDVEFMIGTLVGADGVLTLVNVNWKPQWIATGASVTT